MTIQINLIHSKLKCTENKHIEEKKKPHANSASELHCSREQCNSLARFVCTVQFACTVHANSIIDLTVCVHSASELHCAHETSTLKSSSELLRKIHVQNVNCYGAH